MRQDVKIGEIVKQLKLVPVAVFMTTAAAFAGAQGALPQLKPFTAMCVGTDSIGYNFRGRVAERVALQEKGSYVAKKIDPKLYEDPRTRASAYSMCRDEKAARFSDGSIWTYACYDIKDPRFGTSPIARTCKEKWNASGSLVQIICDDLHFAFHPSGSFVETSSPDLDSVVSLTTGKCSPID